MGNWDVPWVTSGEINRPIPSSSREFHCIIDSGNLLIWIISSEENNHIYKLGLEKVEVNMHPFSQEQSNLKELSFLCREMVISPRRNGHFLEVRFYPQGNAHFSAGTWPCLCREMTIPLHFSILDSYFLLNQNGFLKNSVFSFPFLSKTWRFLIHGALL